MIPLALLALSAPAAGAGPAEANHRALELADGRAFVAEVLATDVGGLRVRVPQGTLTLPFDILRDMRPSDAAAWRDQPAWSVHVAAPDEVRDALLDALRAVPAVEVRPVEEPGGGLAPSAAAAGAACGLDVDCLVDAWRGEPWRILVVALPEGDALRLVGAVSTGAVLHRRDVRGVHDLGAAAHALLGLDAPVAPAPTRVATSPTREPRADAALSFAPVPGLPALRRGDHAAFAAAVGIAAPTTALWVGAVGRNAQTAPEAVALSLAGFYVSTVLANQLTSSSRTRAARP